MDINLIKQAVVEAQRFVDAANEELNSQESKANGDGWEGDYFKSSQERGVLHGGSGTATIKRRSMDLTRSLSKMRQGK